MDRRQKLPWLTRCLQAADSEHVIYRIVYRVAYICVPRANAPAEIMQLHLVIVARESGTVWNRYVATMLTEASVHSISRCIKLHAAIHSLLHTMHTLHRSVHLWTHCWDKIFQ